MEGPQEDGAGGLACELQPSTECFWIQLCVGLQWPSGARSCLVTFSVLRII